MELMLLRHGIAEDQGAKFPADFDRPLTAEGRIRMTAEANAIRKAWLPDAILTSPLVRARQTAELVARACGVDGIAVTDTLTGKNYDEMFAAVAALRAQRVVAVGHEPHLSMAMSYALTGSETAVRSTFKKGAAAVIAFDKEPKAGAGWLEWLIQPALLRSLAPS